MESNCKTNIINIKRNLCPVRWIQVWWGLQYEGCPNYYTKRTDATDQLQDKTRTTNFSMFAADVHDSIKDMPSSVALIVQCCSGANHCIHVIKLFCEDLCVSSAGKKACVGPLDISATSPVPSQQAPYIPCLLPASPHSPPLPVPEHFLPASPNLLSATRQFGQPLSSKWTMASHQYQSSKGLCRASPGAWSALNATNMMPYGTFVIIHTSA